MALLNSVCHERFLFSQPATQQPKQTHSHRDSAGSERCRHARGSGLRSTCHRTTPAAEFWQMPGRAHEAWCHGCLNVNGKLRLAPTPPSPMKLYLTRYGLPPANTSCRWKHGLKPRMAGCSWHHQYISTTHYHYDRHYDKTDNQRSFIVPSHARDRFRRFHVKNRAREPARQPTAPASRCSAARMQCLPSRHPHPPLHFPTRSSKQIRQPQSCVSATLGA